MKKISLCICAHNEEQNIEPLLKSILTQQLTQFEIAELIVVSSSTDRTNSIVTRYHKNYPKVKLLAEKEKRGKVAAINSFLEIAKHKLCVLCSSDILLEKDCVEQLCTPLLTDEIGITGSHPIPLNKKKGLLGTTIHILWDLHHRMALEEPKFGECIAFKNVFGSMPNNSVDEEFIAYLVQQEGFEGRYVPSAIVYNYGPETINDFLIQRRRIHYGHLMMTKQQQYVPTTTKTSSIAKKLSGLLTEYSLVSVIGAVALEAYGRFLGRLDVFRNKQSHTNWVTAQSTKKDLSERLHAHQK
jgi:poly-beta-1,6-N-acetyl-D-glucosamine synthase